MMKERGKQKQNKTKQNNDNNNNDNDNGRSPSAPFLLKMIVNECMLYSCFYTCIKIDIMQRTYLFKPKLFKGTT